jgi:hypothetical protein
MENLIASGAGPSPGSEVLTVLALTRVDFSRRSNPPLMAVPMVNVREVGVAVDQFTMAMPV